MSASPRITVVIPTYRRRHAVECLLQSLTHQSLTPDAFEVVVVVDGAEDGTREMVQTFSAPYALQVHWQPNRGRAAACNVGIARARGDLIVLIDDDMEPLPDWLATHEHAHVEGGRIGVMGAAPIAADGASPVVAYVAEKFNRHLETLARSGRALELRDFYSGNFSIRRSILDEVGGFDEAFTVYGNEDVELALRLGAAGVSLVYSPDAVAHQSYLKDFAGLAMDNVAKGHTAVLLASKHPGTWSRLKLGTFRRVPLPWRLVRAGLLTLGRLAPATTNVVICLGGRFVPKHPRWRDRYVGLLLDYCFWLGVRAALAERHAGVAGQRR